MVWGQTTRAQVVADFSYTQSCLDFQFTDQSTPLGDITSWDWDFGDGSVHSNIQNPTYTYLLAGSYTVTLTLMNAALETDTYNDDVVIMTPVADFTFNQFCDSLEFTDSSTPAGEITAWGWDFGDGIGFSTNQNPTYTYPNPGDFTVSLTVTHNTGCTSIASTQNISVVPTAAFNYIQTCNNINFIDISTPTGEITNWNWYFGDGGTSTNQNPTYTYPIPGDYTVSLVVTHNSGCTDSTSQQVSIVPLADFSFNQFCDSLEFFDASTPTGDITDWKWYFGDGWTSTDKDPTHTYLLPGNYTISLVATHNSGCTDSTSQQVSIVPLATYSFTQFCDSINFTDESTPVGEMNSWEWDFGDGNSSMSQNPIHVYATTGTYTVELVAFHSSGCTDITTQEIIVSKADADFSITQFCDSLNFIDLSSSSLIGIEFWNWDFGDGSGSSIDQNPVYTFPVPGEYTTTLNVIDSVGCSHTKQMVINSLSAIPEFSSQYYCFSDSTIFINETDSQDVEVQSWLWDFDDPASADNTSNEFEPTHSFSTEGPFNIKLLVGNINGCLDSISHTIEIDSLPEPGFSYEYATAGQPTIFTDLSIAHGSFIYNKQWDWGDGTAPGINVNPITHVYNSAGSFTLCLEVTDLNGCSDTLCEEVIVAGQPLADFTYTAGGINAYFTDVTFIDTLTGAKEWLWDFGDSQGTSTETNPYHIFPAQGFYDVNLMVTDSLGGVHDTTKNIYVGNAIIADYITDEDICYGDTSVIFDNSYSPIGDTILSWYWDFDDGYDTIYYEKATILKHFYEIGEYSMLLIITADHGGEEAIDSITRNIFVHPNPVAYFDSVGACKGDQSHFYDLSDSFDSITNWLWNFGDGNISTLQDPVHLYADTGSYAVSLVVTSNVGCKDTIIKNSHVTYAPEVTFVVENACIDSPAKFVPIYNADTYVTDWIWNFGDSNNDTISTEESPTHIYTYFGLYDISVTASSFGCPKTTEKTILVYPIPYADFDMTSDYSGSQGKVMFENGSIYADHFLWDFGNGQTSTVESPIEVYEDDSTYLITLISYNEYGCSDTSWMEYNLFFKGLYFPTAFSPNNPNSEVSLFTPAGVNLAKYHVQVFDMRGNQVWESEAIDDAGRPTESWDGYYDGRLMPQGLYLWQATATFTDGTIWQGTVLQNEEPQLQGTVTLIR